MTFRADPVLYPLAPNIVFGALIQGFPETDVQVVWADGNFGIITVMAKHARGTYNCTLTLRPAPSGHTTVLLQANVAQIHDAHMTVGIPPVVPQTVDAILARVGPPSPASMELR